MVILLFMPVPTFSPWYRKKSNYTVVDQQLCVCLAMQLCKRHFCRQGYPEHTYMLFFVTVLADPVTNPRGLPQGSTIIVLHTMSGFQGVRVHAPKYLLIVISQLFTVNFVSIDLLLCIQIFQKFKMMLLVMVQHLLWCQLLNY